MGGNLENAMRKIEQCEQFGITRLPASEEQETIVQLKQKYKDTVLLEISQSGRILHSVLANRIKVSASGLNAIIKRLNDLSDKPICMEKSGKFTYYMLSDSGKAYVEDVLFPSFVNNEKEKKVFENIYQLLNAFRDKNQAEWQEKLLDIVRNESTVDDEGNGFLNELSYYCAQSEEKAHLLLRVLIPEKDYYQPIVDYLKMANKLEAKSAEELLCQWLQEDEKEVYLLLDALFEWLNGNSEYPDSKKYGLRYVEQHMSRVCDWLLAQMLKALMQNMNKVEISEYISSLGLDWHMAWFLAEKCQTIRQYIRLGRE